MSYPAVTPEDCARFQNVLHSSNTISAVRLAAGGLALIGCIAAALVIFGYRKDVRSLRDRLLLAVFVSNAIYALSDCIPSNLEVTSGPRCGDQLLQSKDQSTNASFYALWGLGMYASASYELFMVLVSISALRTATTTIRPRTEVVGHVLCVVLGVGAGIGGAMGNRSISSSNSTDDDKASHDVDFNHSFYGVVVAMIFVTLVVWVYLRIYLHTLFKEWNQAKTHVEKKAGKSVRARENKLRLLELQRTSYVEITRPLEKYILVFVVFLPPLIVGLSTSCVLQSIQSWKYWDDVACLQFVGTVLAFRSLTMAVAYFWDSQCRSQLYHFPHLLSLVATRVRGVHKVRFRTSSGLENVYMISETEEHELTVMSKHTDDGGDDHDRNDNNDVAVSMQPYHLMGEEANT